ncbi:DUF3558 family protein [Amycolatopsis sp. H20-H5]|uniref:DUF3558 family protein n=1 Tax=Amycolatopsis sp. H20-H5 TaxID=3046309 RepID=UPI002DBF6DFE|nr:DUF3558 family protein [Amycolatopsis sp. H20-H5]MEC3982817.1 DUF3558 family protein [Amycolatopsis sp. H20-H5]
MSISRKLVAVALVGSAVLLSGCTTLVAGSPKPVPGQGPVITAANPCGLLTPEHAKALGLQVPGKLAPAIKEQLAPAFCTWSPSDPDSGLESVMAGQSDDLSPGEYTLGAVAKETFQLGGLSWSRYPSILGEKYCEILVKLGPKSFVDLSSENRKDPSKACDQAKAVAPAIASHLPGGDPSPTIVPPPSSTQPVPSGPLATLDPCTLLKGDQLPGLKLVVGEPLKSSTKPLQTGCEWYDTDGPQGQKSLDLWISPIQPANEWPFLETGGQPLEANGKQWLLFPNFDREPVLCSASLAVTPTSSVMLASGNLTEPDKACDVIKAAIPLISANFPAS